MTRSASPQDSAGRGAEGNSAAESVGRGRPLTPAELEADAIGSHADAMRAIGEAVRAGATLPPLHGHLFYPRRRGGFRR
jgi:hypothetical protein